MLSVLSARKHFCKLFPFIMIHEMINLNIWISDENLMSHNISKVIQREFHINFEEVFNDMLSDKIIFFLYFKALNMRKKKFKLLFK